MVDDLSDRRISDSAPGPDSPGESPFVSLSFASVILAAGKGTRMKSRKPKALHPVCGKPMLEIIADSAEAAGLTPVTVVVPGDSEAIRRSLGDRCLYAVQKDRLGTGHALMKARGVITDCDNIMVMAGDTPLIRPETLTEMTRTHISSEAPITMLTSELADPDGLGRVVRNANDGITSIVEQKEADPQTLNIREINAGVYCFRTSWLWDNLPRLKPSSTGEIFLTDLIEVAADQGHEVASIALKDANEAFGVNTRLELSRVESIMRDRIRRYWMMEGVSIPDPESVYIDYDARVGMDTVILPNTHIKSDAVIGEDCEIGPNSVIADSRIGDQCRIVSSVVEEAIIESDVHVGPFSHIRPGAYLESEVRIGNFGEIKNSRIGRGTKSGHFSYIGDADVGENVNIGAGSITCNYDGQNKHRTVIGDDVFIGCDTMMVAPVTIGDRSYTGTGSIINKDVPPDSGAIGAPARIRSRKPAKNSASPDGNIAQ